MSIDEQNPYASLDATPPRKGTFSPIVSAAGAALGKVRDVLLRLLRVGKTTNDAGQVGTKFPWLQAEGWLNGDPVSNQQLLGKVVAVNAWAYWCGHCRTAAPELVALHEKYHRQGLQFVGLTLEGSEKREQIELFLQDAAIPWPNAYGAGGTLQALGAEFIPQMWIIDRQGNIAWNQHSPEDRHALLDRLLRR